MNEANIAVTTKTLERLKVGATMAGSARLDVSPEFFGEQLAYRLSATVLADKLAEDRYERSTDLPKSAWHQWKADHRNRWPSWLRWLARPVQTRRFTVSVDVKRYLNYPQAAIALPEFGAPVIFEQASTSLRWSPS